MINRREFLFNAAAGLFIASTPKIIVDMGANTWREQQKSIAIQNYMNDIYEILYKEEFYRLQYKQRYGMVSGPPAVYSGQTTPLHPANP